MSKVKQVEIELALEDLVGQRFNKETLEAKLSTIFKQPITVEDISREDDELSDLHEKLIFSKKVKKFCLKIFSLNKKLEN